MNRSEQINDLAAALAIAQGIISNAEKTASNPFFKSKYAPLDAVWDAIRKPFTDNGLSVIQFPMVAEDMVKLETVVLHSSGQYISETLALPYKDKTPQGVGSAITYARRYALQSVAGVCAEEDDDGNSASGKDGNKNNQTGNSQTGNQNKASEGKQDNNNGNNNGNGNHPNEKQCARLYKMAADGCLKEEQVHKLLNKFFKKESAKDLTANEYKNFCGGEDPNHNKYDGVLTLTIDLKKSAKKLGNEKEVNDTIGKIFANALLNIDQTILSFKQLLEAQVEKLNGVPF